MPKQETPAQNVATQMAWLLIAWGFCLQGLLSQFRAEHTRSVRHGQQSLRWMPKMVAMLQSALLLLISPASYLTSLLSACFTDYCRFYLWASFPLSHLFFSTWLYSYCQWNESQWRISSSLWVLQHHDSRFHCLKNPIIAPSHHLPVPQRWPGQLTTQREYRSPNTI